MPTRFFYLKSEGPFQYNINSTSGLKEIGNGSAEISGNRTSVVRLKFPVLNKQRIVVTGGLRYSDEQFYFNHSSPEAYPLYVSLNNRNLKTVGFDVKGFFHLKDNRSIIMLTSWNLAGDFYRDDKGYFSLGDLLKSSLAVGYAIKKDETTYKAFGLYFGYTFGRPSIYPVYNYEKRFKNGIGLNMMLPQGIKVWKNFNNKFYLFGNSEISGNSYTVRLFNSVLDEAESLQLRQSTLNTTVGVVQKINKWLWIEGEFGYSYNINFNVSETNFKENSTLPRPNTDYLIESDLSGAPFFSISLFLALPNDLLNKYVK
uniref:hypothetical protein n=1 Tax=uncultured Draconibacterium sp. TaxID=1573823 RepID=UPI003217AB2A